MQPALIGLACLLLAPLNLLAVALCAVRGRYPWWMDTPDDPFVTGPVVPPHYGHYEPTVRAVYARLGRYLGDLYWLGLRNRLAGLRYRCKPARFIGVTDYTVFAREVLYHGRWLTEYRVEGCVLWQLNLGRFEWLAGWMVRGAALDPYTPRQPVNMEFTPTFGPRRAG